MDEETFSSIRLCPTCNGLRIIGGGQDYYGEYWVEDCGPCGGTGRFLWMMPKWCDTNKKESEFLKEFWADVGEF